MGLNFTGAIAGLGHGLATLGQQGMEEQQRIAADQRLTEREQALASLNHDYRTSEADATSKREINQYEAATPGVVTRDALEAQNVRIPERRVEGEISRANADHNSQRDFQEQMAMLSARDRLDFQRWRQQHSIEQADQRSLELWRRDTGVGDYAHAPTQRRNAATGHYDEYRNGQWVDSGVPFPVTQHGDDLGLDDEGSSGGGTPAPAAAPTGRGGRPVLAPRSQPQSRVTAPPGSIVRDAAGHRYRVNPDGSFTALGA